MQTFARSVQPPESAWLDKLKARAIHPRVLQREHEDSCGKAGASPGRRSLRQTTRVSLVVLSVLLFLLSLPGGPFPVLAWISLIPLGLAIHGATALPSAGYAFAFGFVGWVGSTHGLAIGLSSYTELPFFQALFLVGSLCAFLALPYGLFGFLYGRFQWMNHPVGALKTAACLSLLVSITPTPLPVGPAHALYVFPMFIQLLDLGGEPLLLFGLCLINWMFVDLILRIRRRAHLTIGVAALCSVLGVVTAYGWFRLQQYAHEELHAEPGRLITIATVQPNTALPTQLATDSEGTENPLDLLLEMSAQALSTNPRVNLMVWPETSTSINCSDAVNDRAWIATLAKRYDVAFLINCIQQLARRGVHNTALLVSERQAAVAYHKQRLLPFAEYIPGEKRFPQLRELVPGAASVVPGVESVVFGVGSSFAVAPIICYEILFPDHVSAFVRKGANVLVTSNNDAWFGSTRVPAFLVASAVYRATENRVPLIRSSNSGNSLAVRASGEIVLHSRTVEFTRTSTVATVFVPRDRSVYARLGNSLFYCVLLLWAAVDLLYARDGNKEDQ